MKYSRIRSIYLLAILPLFLMQNSLAQDLVEDAAKSCMQKNIIPLTECPEYNAAIKQTQQIIHNAYNDPTIKAKNKKAFDDAVAAGIGNK